MHASRAQWRFQCSNHFLDFNIFRHGRNCGLFTLSGERLDKTNIDIFDTVVLSMLLISEQFQFRKLI